MYRQGIWVSGGEEGGGWGGGTFFRGEEEGGPGVVVEVLEVGADPGHAAVQEQGAPEGPGGGGRAGQWRAGQGWVL